MLSVLNPLNGAIGRNIQLDPQVIEALNHAERPLPNLGGFSRWFLGWIELPLTLVLSILPFWETDLYIKVVYHSWLKNAIKSSHPRQVEETAPAEGQNQPEQNGLEIPPQEIDP